MKKITALLAIGLGCAANAVGATAGDYAFQGYVNYSNTDEIGWFYVAEDGAKTYAWTDALAQSIQSPMVFGWMREGRICGVSSVSVSGSIRSYEYVEIDPATGEYEVSKPISLRGENNQANYLNYYRTAAYDPTTDRIYGYGHNAAGTAFVFKTSAPDFTDTRVIREISDAEYCSSLTYNESENRLVGFNRVSFVYVDRQTGLQTQAYNPNLNNFMFTYTGLMYDQYKRAYYWSYFTNDNKSHLALVDLNSKRLDIVRDYTDMTQFSFMVPMTDSNDTAAPEKPLLGEIDFPKGALSGTVTFSLPAKTNGGDAVSGNVDWTLWIDGSNVAKGVGNAGTAVSERVENLTAGEHLFMVSANYNGKESMPDSKTCYIGPDTPGIPANVTLDATTVRWDAVTEGIHGGYVDPSAIVYNVTLNGQPLGQTAQTEMAVTYPSDVRYTAFTASVSAVNGSEISEGGVSNVFLAGKPLALPLSLSPDKNQAMLFTVEDSGLSGDVWSFNNDVLGQEVFISGSSESAVDEWLFLPPVECQKADGVYKISLNAALDSEDAKEAKIEIRAGREAASEAMKTVVLPLTDVSNTAFKEFSGLFSLSGDLLGTEGVVLGVRAYAPDGGARIKTRRFKVELTTLSDKAPCDPSELTVEAGAAGALNAKVSFVMPSKTLDGVDIPSDTDVTVTILNDSKDVVTGKPGSRQSITIDAYHGINEIEVTPSLGSVKGQKLVREVYCGVDIPRGVENLQAKVSEDNLTAVVTWDIPAKGINGGYIDPDGLTFWLCVYDKNTDSYRQYAELGTTPEYVMQLPQGSQLMTYDVIIQAVSTAGASPEYASQRVQLGTPYTLPINETFNQLGQQGVTYGPISPVTTGEYAGTSWVLSDPKLLEPEYEAPASIAMVGTTTLGGTLGCVQFPKYSTKGNEAVKAGFTIYESSITPDIALYAMADDMEDYEFIGKLPKTGSGYTTQWINLPSSYAGKGWVSMYFIADFQSVYQMVLMSDYQVTASAGIGEIEADFGFGPAVYGSEGTLTVSGAAGESVAVYSADGRLAASVASAAEVETFRLTPGLYIVRAGGKSLKTIVR